MNKATRILGAVLCAVLLLSTLAAGTARAETVTLQITLYGATAAPDGTEGTVRLDGRLRIWQNGEEVSVIASGDYITMPEGARIRIEPLREYITPGWDVSGAAADLTVNKSNTAVSVVLRPMDAAAAAAANPAEAEPAGGEERLVVANTLILPEVSEVTMTPAPEFAPLAAGADTGTLRVRAFDSRGNGVSGVTVYLLQDDQPIAGAATDGNGMAAIENIPAGTYRTQAFLPAGKVFAEYEGAGTLDANAFRFTTEGSQTSDEFTVSAGSETLQGIGVDTAYHVSGFCWLENDPDGTYKKGEPGLGGVRVTLDGQKNGLHYETTSAADGSWTIDRVLPAFYTLTVYVPDGFAFTRTGSGGTRSIFTKEGTTQGTKTLNLNDKENKEGQTVGFVQSAVIQAICYLDANYNGVYDAGEPPMPGVRLTVVKTQDNSDLGYAVSGEDGRFVLSGLRGNTYRLRALLPDDGSVYTTLGDGSLGNRFRALPGRRESFWDSFELNTRETRVIAIGAIYPATIRGTVYFDDDFSGTHSSGEKICTSFVVSLLNAQGQTVTQDKTGVKGVYELVGVPPGEYTLSVNAVSGYAFTKRGEGNVILNGNGGQGYSEPFSVSLRDSLSGMDIGMIRPGTVEGYVYYDRNDNGTQDSDERGMAGAEIRLIEETEGEAFRTVIGEDGHYLFDAVMPGRYRVECTLPEGAVFAAGTEWSEAGRGTAATEAFDFKTGEYRRMPLCGALELSRIAGAAFQDENGNGQQDEGEEPMDGVTVTLIPSRAALSEVTAVTGEDGTFEIAELRPDTYTLRVTCPDGFVVSRTDSLGLPLTAGRYSQDVPLELPAGTEISGQMIGTVMPAAIRGRVWMDENNDGIFEEGERTPAGLTVVITDKMTGNVFDTPVTDVNGVFEASGMIPGMFRVSFPLDEDTLAPRPGDSQFTEADGQLVLDGIELHENELWDGVLLGIVRCTRISGHVWIDRGEGTTEALPGTRVTLTDGNGNTLASAVSDENGEYAFGQLMPGQYRLEAETPEGCVIIEPDDPRLGGSLRSVMTETVNRNGTSAIIDLEMDRNRTEMDIGCVLPGSLGDFCWLDLNGDGMQGAGEGGIPGVRIEAQRNGVTVAETVTDQYGLYRISDLYPAEYVLKVTPPAEVVPTMKRSGPQLIVSSLEETMDTVCYTSPVTVESNRPNYNVDMGFMLRHRDVYPAGYGEGEKQLWAQP